MNKEPVVHSTDSQNSKLIIFCCTGNTTSIYFHVKTKTASEKGSAKHEKTKRKSKHHENKT
jgi:hypothetical protein